MYHHDTQQSPSDPQPIILIIIPSLTVMVMFPEKPALAMAEAAAVKAPPTAWCLSDRLSILRKTLHSAKEIHQICCKQLTG